MAKSKLNLKPMQNLKRQLKSAVTKAVKAVSKDVKKRIKSRAPKLTGALRQSIAEKVSVKKMSATAVIGPRTKFEKYDKIPNKYAGKRDKETKFISGSVSDQDIEAMRQAVKRATEEVLKR